MKYLSAYGFCRVLFLAALLPALAWAQEPVHSLPELETRVFLGDTVRVIDLNGQKIDGRLQRISADSLGLVVDGGLRELPEGNIREVRTRRPDKWWNGLLIGAGIGFGTGVWLSAGLCDGFISECTVEGGLILGLGLTGAGAGVGALVDRLISKYDTIYERSATSVRFNLAPIFSKETQGIRFSVSF